MRISQVQRVARIAERQRRALEPKEKPRFALRLARFFIGEPYEEEVLPAEVINFFGVGTVVFVLVVLTVVVYLTSLLL